MASVMAMEDSCEPKGSGRRQLQGVLDELVQQTKETDEKQLNDVTEDSAVEEAAKSLVELPNSIKLDDSIGAKRKGYGSPRKRRRRTKKELFAISDESDGELKQGKSRHIPHVMTLFDRRVDLAMFSEVTPLYVMCREWMKNTPQGKRSYNISNDEISAESADVHLSSQEPLSFPSPQPIPVGQSSSIPIALSPHNTPYDLDKQLNKQNDSDDDEYDDDDGVKGLKKQHIERWKTIKSRWMACSLAKQDRYEDSLKLLRDMFQR